MKMKRYKKVKNEWGETEEFTKEAGLDQDPIDVDVVMKNASNAVNYSTHITPDYKEANEPTLKGALTLIIILYLIGFASCYGLFWTGLLHV